MSLSLYLKKIPYLASIKSLAGRNGCKIWLVGGFLRDAELKLKKELTDFDFCIDGDVYVLAKKFSQTIGAKLIVLDEDELAYRVIKKKKGVNYKYDFSRIRGKDIYQDLSCRDFSVNSLALRLDRPRVKLLDYFGGIKDLKKKRVRLIQDKNFNSDPLRILRGFSFMAKYGFKVTRPTLEAMHCYRKKIRNVSTERVNEELFKILSSASSYKTIKLMDKYRIIDEVIPFAEDMRGVGQGRYHHLDVWSHSIETLKKLELFLKRKKTYALRLSSYLNEMLARNRRRVQILKLACLLHDSGKPKAKKKIGNKTMFHTHEKIGARLSQELAQNLRLSSRENSALVKMVFWHLRPGYLADQIAPSSRAVYRFFRDTQEEGISVILLSFSDWRATRGPLTDFKKRKRHERIMLKLIDLYFKDLNRKEEKPLLDGHEIMNRFGIPSGPLVGEVLSCLKEKQALGEINNKKEACKEAARIIKIRQKGEKDVDNKRYKDNRRKGRHNRG
ncbi:MAG: HD domain-containing protein [Candidatus Omnitrophica bacterium]|nr:HD domain-containing protein [Candidatus Omnitrophota bacterium]MBD3269304.1 HD domain-containing protein [Candidatus Omnitrophota bacterium]